MARAEVPIPNAVLISASEIPVASAVESGAPALASAANERIIDLRYPEFRSDVDVFYSSGALQDLQGRAVDTIISDTVGRRGYEVAVGLRPQLAERGADAPVRVDVVLDGEHAVATIDALGFTDTVAGPALEVAAIVRDRFGNPSTVDLYDVGPWAWRSAELLAAVGDIVQHRNYPARV